MKRSERVRTSHDELTKRVLSLWLHDLGDVQCDVRIPGEARRGDVLFKERKTESVRRDTLGLLGDLARGFVLFEPFRNPVTPWEIVTCVMKAVEHSALRLREARRAKGKLSLVARTALCVITPSASAKVKSEAGLKLIRRDEPGVYRMADLFRTVVVVAGELAQRADTLWLRLLGRGVTQLEALRELEQMAKHDPLRDGTIKLFVEWHDRLPEHLLTNTQRGAEMTWERTFRAWKAEIEERGLAAGMAKGMAKGMAEGKAAGIAAGKAEGLAAGKAEALLMVLEQRGLSISAAQRKQILACKDIAQLDQWLASALSAASVKEVLAMRVAPPAPRPRQRASRRAA